MYTITLTHSQSELSEQNKAKFTGDESLFAEIDDDNLGHDDLAASSSSDAFNTEDLGNGSVYLVY